MKKTFYLAVFVIALVACNNKQDCDTYPYCISDYSIHPESWLCGRLNAEPSPLYFKNQPLPKS